MCWVNFTVFDADCLTFSQCVFWGLCVYTGLVLGGAVDRCVYYPKLACAP